MSVESASSIQEVNSADSIVACQQEAADFFDSIGPWPPWRAPFIARQPSEAQRTANCPRIRALSEMVGYLCPNNALRPKRLGDCPATLGLMS